MNRAAETAEHWLGLCPKAPAMHRTAAVLNSEPELVHRQTPGGSGPGGKPGRIRDGISIAAASLKAIIRDRQLLWFSLLAGLVMLFLVLAEGWSHRYIDPAFPATILIGDLSFLVDLQYLWVGIPIGGSHHVIFSFGFFLIELVCLSGFILLLAGLVLHRAGDRERTPVTFRGGLSALRGSSGSFAALSVGMALLATAGYDLISYSPFYNGIIGSIMKLFWLPWAYYAPQNWALDAVYYSAFFASIEIMVINILLLLAALYLVPSLVLEKRGLLFAIAASVTRLKQTWREVLGCFMVFLVIALGVFAVGVLIGQLPALLNHDYDFFLSASRGYLPMMAVCYGFILSCWILMAAGFSAAGVAITDLYQLGKSGVSGTPEGSRQEPGPGS